MFNKNHQFSVVHFGMILVLLVGMLGGTPARAAGAWEIVGTAGFSAGGVQFTSLALDNSTPYVAYADYNNGNRATVMKFNGMSWELVGASGFSTGGAFLTTLAMDGSTPYVAYRDESNNHKIMVMKFNGMNWEPVGAPDFSAGSVVIPCLSLALDGSTPYVAYMDESNGYKATVMKFNGMSWEPVGAPGFSAGQAEAPSLALDGSTPYVAYMDEANNWKATVMKFNGMSWEPVGVPGFSTGTARVISLALDGSTPYVVYTDGDKGGKATVMKFDGMSWEPVGVPGFSAGLVNFTSLALDGGTPYVAYADSANGNKAMVMKFNGTSWEAVGAPGFSAGDAYFTSLALDGSTPYVTYADGANGSKATVMKLGPDTSPPTVVTFAVPPTSTSLDIPITAFYVSDPFFDVAGFLITESATPPDSQASGWTIMPPTIYTVATLGSHTLYPWAKDAADNVSLVYSSPATVTVIPNPWETVGAAGFSADEANYTSLDLDSSGKPYVAYADGANSDKATVMKFNGASWETVGTAGFTPGPAAYLSLALDSHDMPYVAYQDGNNNSKATVMKFNGSSWQTVGTPGISTYRVWDTSLALDSSDTPYLAYKDEWNSCRATVKKFNGTSWQTVGTAGFSAGVAANYVSLALYADTPYVSFEECASSCKVTVMKYNGSGWENVGTPGFSAGRAWSTSLALNSSGTPYVAYSDDSTGYKATVMTFNGTAWETVGTAGFSPGEASYTSLALDNSGAPLVAYRDRSNGDRATVMKFNGTSWETVGAAGFSAGRADYNSLALDNSGRLHVAYVDYGNSAKATVMKLEPPDITAPIVDTFTVPATSISLEIPIVNFTASDNLAVTGFLITESSTPPLADDPGWTSSAPSTHIVGSGGAHTLYPWTKDAAGNVSGVYDSPSLVTVVSTVMYAIPGGLSSGYCESWANGCELRYVLSRAVSGQEIWVAAGVYKPGTLRTDTFLLKSGVAVYGGFAGTETLFSERNPVEHITILSGDIDNNDSQMPIITNPSSVTGNYTNSYHVVTGATGGTLDGFTITAGFANAEWPNNTVPNRSGGGMYNSDAAPLLKNLVFSGNSAYSYGGGMYNLASSPTVTNVTFSNNAARTEAGGGMYNENSSPTIVNATFSGNTADRYGGGMYNKSSSPTIVNATFSGNSASYDGGGMDNNSGSPTITNVTFSGNSATYYGGGMSNNASSPTLTNVTISGNSAMYYNGGFSARSNSNPILKNVIIANSTSTLPGSTVSDCSLVSATLDAASSNNLIESTGADACGLTNGVNGNIIGLDPLLGTLGNYGGFTQTLPLLPDSPAINAGTDSVSICDSNASDNFDQRGVTRPQGTHCDIGAYEVEHLTISGNAGVGDAVVKYGYGLYTDADTDGNYTIRVLPGWTGTIIPSRPGYSFTPAKMDYTDIQVDQANHDYTAAANTYSSPNHSGDTWRVSITNNGGQTDDDSSDPSISADGRYVAFASSAVTLTPEDDPVYIWDIFVRDNQTGEVELVSTHSDGTKFQNNSFFPVISADGRYVAFVSFEWYDTSVVFVHDRHTGLTEALPFRGPPETSGKPSISADGRYIAYMQNGILTEGDSNNAYDIFIYDQWTTSLERISLSSDEVQGDGASLFPSLSGDGQYVAFQSSATNLVDGDTNGAEDIFVRDIQMGTTRRVSVASSDVQANGGSFSPSISGDGRYVAFHSAATNLVSGDTNGREDVFVHDLQTGETVRVSISSEGVQGNKSSNHAQISANGRSVAFRSAAANLISGDTNGVTDVFVYDRQTGKTKRVSVASNGTQANGATSSSDSPGLSISADGTYIAFSSDATNMVTGDTNAYRDIFVHDASILTPVVLSAPANSVLLLHRRPTFDWENVPGTTYYQIVASQSSTFNTVLWKVNTATNTYTTTADLPAGKVIYWRVRAKVGSAWSPWSETWRFKTAKPPSIPVLVSPANKAITQDYTPLFKWKVSTIPSGGAAFDHYQVQVSTNKAFPEPLLIDVNDVTISAYTPTGALTANQRYYWRVRAFNTAGEYSSWSTVWSFSTALPPPGNLTPTGGETVDIRKPIMDWNLVEGASGYTVQISTSSSFSILLVNETVKTDTFTPGKNLPVNKKIYWRVCATGTKGPSKWTTASFYTP